ncbi:MAG: carboxypeptidase-like regulatory domain-containing protein, partial [Mangrovibacterium sp.]
MRLTLGLLLILAAQGWATKGYSQKAVLNLDMKNAKIVDVLEEIEDQTDYYFLFNYEQINSDKRINVSLTKAKIDETLNTILKGTDLKYTIKDRQIVISKDETDANYLSSVLILQQISISGKVTDSSGQPLPGVTVVVKGSTNGTITDVDGNYSLPNVTANETLVFSFVGMKTREIPVAGKTNINLIMEEETIGLDEVVAIGYGTVKKSDLTGSVGVVKSNQLDQQINNNMGAAIQGKIAGVSVESSGGAPGAGMNLQIRGAGSLNNNNPL